MVVDVAEDQRWLSPAQAGRLLGVTPTRVRQILEEGRLSYRQTALGRLIDRGSVEALCLERERRRAVSEDGRG